MSRYIDADALEVDYYDDYETEDDVYTYPFVSKDQIDSAPSIDIVFCKECKHKRQCLKAVQHTTHKPASVTIAYRPIDFCSYGERESE